MKSSLNPLPIHLPRWTRRDAHSMRIGFQVVSCEHDKPDWMHIQCTLRCPCEQAFTFFQDLVAKAKSQLTNSSSLTFFEDQLESV